MYRDGKPTMQSDAADTVFLMMRLKNSAVEQTLKTMIPGLYLSPRLDSGEPDPQYKVIWCADRKVADLRILAPSTQGVLGIVKSRTGCGLRVRCADYSNIRSKLYPDWKPQQDTPYDTSLPLRFSLHHVHPGASKGDLQTLLNNWPWKALVLKQSRPEQWLVASDAEPPKSTILTERGCILVLPVQGPVVKGKGTGKSKSRKGKGPAWLLGSSPSSSTGEGHAREAVPPQLPLATCDIHGPIKKAVLEAEQKMEQRLADMRSEAQATHAILQEDVKSMKQEFQDHVTQQRKESAALAERVNGVESSLANQLSTFMSSLNATLSQQNTELTGRLQAGQESLRSELTAELRNHVHGGRKRTPPPPEEDRDKRMRDGA